MAETPRSDSLLCLTKRWLKPDVLLVFKVVERVAMDKFLRLLPEDEDVDCPTPCNLTHALETAQPSEKPLFTAAMAHDKLMPLKFPCPVAMREVPAVKVQLENARGEWPLVVEAGATSPVAGWVRLAEVPWGEPQNVAMAPMVPELLDKPETCPDGAGG